MGREAAAKRHPETAERTLGPGRQNAAARTAPAPAITERTVERSDKYLYNHFVHPAEMSYVDVMLSE